MRVWHHVFELLCILLMLAIASSVSRWFFSTKLAYIVVVPYVLVPFISTGAICYLFDLSCYYTYTQGNQEYFERTPIAARIECITFIIYTPIFFYLSKRFLMWIIRIPE